MRISDWSSDVCSSDLGEGLKAGSVVWRRLAEAQDAAVAEHPERDRFQVHAAVDLDHEVQVRPAAGAAVAGQADRPAAPDLLARLHQRAARLQVGVDGHRSEEHTSELQSLMRIS